MINKIKFDSRGEMVKNNYITHVIVRISTDIKPHENILKHPIKYSYLVTTNRGMMSFDHIESFSLSEIASYIPVLQKKLY